MRTFAVIAIALLVLPVAVRADGSDVIISELLPDPDGGREFIELWNGRDTDVVLDGWVVEDAAGTVFTFPAWTLPPGGRVVVWGGGESDARGPAWSRASVWNNGGDTAILRDAAGNEVDRLTYGTDPEAPGPGFSLQWMDGWMAAEPTPGQAPGASGGAMAVDVANVAPRITILDAPTRLAPGEAGSIRFQLDDDNGDAVHWTLTGPDGTRNGTGTGEQVHVVIAPQTEADHAWVIEATDGNATVSETVVIPVRLSPLELIMPPGGVRFPALSPGQQEAPADAAWSIRNQGNTTLVPRIDISPFRGPIEWAAAGNVRLVLDDGTVVDYDGPMTELPPLAPGASVAVTVVIERVPVPFPSGTYGTSFAVTA